MHRTGFKLLIVDDDPWVRDGLKEIVPWNELGFEWIKEAFNGSEALEVSRQMKPDAALVDISMPVMDGLEFIQIIKHEQPGMKIVIMTCHDDFHYAQRALKLGCEDYLLKNTSEVEKIEQVLKKLYVSVVEQKKHEQSQKIVEALDTRSDHLLKDKWFAHLSEDNTSEDYIMLLPFAERLQKECLLPLRICISRITNQDLHKVKSKLISELANEDEEFFIYKNDIYAFLPFEYTPSFSYQIHTAMERAERVRNMLRREIPNLFVIFMAAPFKGLNHFRGLAGQFAKLLEQSFYTLPNSIVSWVAPHSYGGGIPVTKRDMIQYLHKEIEKKADEESNEKEWLRQVAAMKLEPHTLKQWMHESLELKEPLSAEIIEWLDCLMFSAFWHEAKHAFIRLVKLKEQTRPVKMRSELKIAMEYIAQNYHHGTLTLGSIADHVSLTPNYLGSIFKKETGSTVIDYINWYRIEMAKALVKENGLLKGYEVAERVGFNDPQYFGRLFKRVVGISFKQFQFMNR